MAPDPRILYKQHLAARRAEIAHREQRHRMLGHGKLAMAAFALVLVWMALAQGAFSILWVLIPIAGFALLVVVHEKLLKELERRRRAARFFEKALARLDGNWAGTGEPGDRYNEAAHPYALDLDLFGKGSLFELLCTARTRIGEDRLAQWLKSPAAPDVVRARHAAVEELRDRVDLREELAIVAEEARSGVDPVHLAHWGEAPAALRQSALPLAGSPAYRARPGRFCGALDSPGAGGKPDRPERRRGCAAARPVPGGAGGQRLVPVPPKRHPGRGGFGSGGGGARIGAALRSAGAHGARAVPLPAAGRPARVAGCRGRTALAATGAPQAAGGEPGFARQRRGARPGALHPVDAAPGA